MDLSLHTRYLISYSHHLVPFHLHITWSFSQRSKTRPESDMTFPRSQSNLGATLAHCLRTQCGFPNTTLSSILQVLLGEGQPGHSGLVRLGDNMWWK